MIVLKNDVDQLLHQFAEFTNDPTSFLNNQPEIENGVKTLVKQCYDNSKLLENRSKQPAFTLPRLVIKNFDAEQIWQQIELQNKFVLKELDTALQNIISELPSHSDSNNDEPGKRVRLALHEKKNDDEDLKVSTENSDLESDLIDEDDSPDDEYSDDSDECSSSKDDGENKLSDDDDEGDDDDDDINGENISRDNEETLNEDDADSDITENEMNENSPVISHPKALIHDTSRDNESENKSSFEERQQRLLQRVQKLEEDLLAEKPWQLKGEISAKKRPQNSLIEEYVEFDLSSRPAPVITEEAALKLEDVIKSRIINKVWDDVERKVKPVDTPREFKKKLVLDQEKSKLSLAQVYEQDYLKQREAANPESKNKEDEEPKEHKQLRVSLDTLFRKLDALSNYHYTPLPSIPEPQIITNLPAVTLEEAIPDATSVAALLAPEEIQGKIRGDLAGKDERTTTDKKRARRKKKVKQRAKLREMKIKEQTLNKLKPVKGNKYAKEKLQRDINTLKKTKFCSQLQEDSHTGKSIKSSKQFFEQLQNTIAADNKKKRKQDSGHIESKRIKL